jgi:flavin-dependent dehydrogenase
MSTVIANSAFTQPEGEHDWLTVGDACAAHDPLCGWGVCRAMNNGILAADAISHYL